MDSKENLQLEEKSDVFGEQLWDCYKTGSGYQIIERDDGFIDAGPTQTYFTEYKEWEDHTKKSLELVKGKVLDVGCGAGRHALYLQSKGFDVVGIDNSPLSIKICKERGLNKAEVLSIEELDKLESEAFDTILMLGNNFGLFGTPEKSKRLLKVFYQITSKDGIIIAETRDNYKTDVVEHQAYIKLNQSNGKLGGQNRIRVRHKKAVSPWFEFLYVSKNELEEIIKDTGWEVNHYIDDVEQGQRYVAVLRKS